ncbi:hypothetical protein [Aureliella helgolandensis]|uniref:Uncharacterized protein n=1 Tax=Aureliella helgolandensis TaxID=2527968 RepID=A0A518G527_9BACT|nr:hypothetical protein [Aureliella helgolandensis]QDV23693.1 hypothetical protein Q31a_19980 [Aureliella helgolandensis]
MLFFLVCLLAPPIGQAQEDSETVDRTNSSWPNILQNGTLNTQARIWFRGEDGKIVLLANSSLEEILKLRGQDSTAGLSNAFPNYSFTEVSVVADARGELAEVEGKFSVALGAADRVAQVPLYFDSCRLTTRPVMTGEATKQAFRPSSDSTGYEWLLIGDTAVDHSITLQGKSIIEQDADRRSLRFSLPQTPCNLKITLPLGVVDVRARSEDIIEQSVGEQSVELKVASRGGEFVLSWRVGGGGTRVAAVEAESQTSFEVGDPALTWQCTTNLEVRWYGTDAEDQVIIRLPPGARWRNIPNSDFERYRLTRRESSIAPESEQNPDTSTAQDLPPEQSPPSPGLIVEELLLENFDIKQNRSIDLPLSWEWTPGLQEDNELSVKAKIPGIVIEGVDSHHGRLECRLPSLYSIVFESLSGASLLQQGPSSDDGFAGKRILFDFDRQNFDLVIAFRRSQSLPIVRPTYHVRVDRNKLVLTGWLDCSFDPNQLQREIGLVMPDSWILQENTARTLTNPESPFEDTGEVLRVRSPEDNDGTYILTAPDSSASNANSNRRIEQIWRIVAEREWKPDNDNALEFRIPEIIRGQLDGAPLIDPGSGTLLVSSEDNILLRDSRSSGLLTDTFSTEYQKYVKRIGVRKPLVFRFQNQSTTPYWAGNVGLLPQQISLSQNATIEVLNSQIEIQQMFDLQISNEPLEKLRFAVRQDADQVHPPQVIVDGNSTYVELVETMGAAELAAAYPGVMAPEPLSKENAKSKSSEATPSTWQIYQFVGVPELLGTKRILLETSITWDNSATALPGNSAESPDKAVAPERQTKRVHVPLARLLIPANTLRLKEQWVLLHNQQLGVQPVTGQNQPSFSLDDEGNTIRQLPPLQTDIELELTIHQQREAASIRVERSWLQTAITGDERRDRYVAQVSTTASELRLQLPKFIRKLMVYVDGVQQTDLTYRYDNTSDTLVIQSPSGTKQLHVIEVSYFLQENLSWFTRIDIKAPQITGAEYLDVFYWQLVTPQVQHLLWPPEQLTAEWLWQWSGLWWFRSSGDTDLERSIGATKQANLPPAMNRYLMSSRLSGGPNASGAMHTWIVSRFALWFPVGVFAIAMSYLLLNYSVFRRPVSLMVYAVGLGGLATIVPDLAMVLGQTSVIALSLVGLVWSTQIAIDSRVRRRSVFTHRPASHVDSNAHYSGTRNSGPAFAAPASPSTTHGGSSVAANGGN